MPLSADSLFYIGGDGHPTNTLNLALPAPLISAASFCNIFPLFLFKAQGKLSTSS
jgi:hypothetical protein